MASLFAVASADTKNKQAFVPNASTSSEVDASGKVSSVATKSVPFGQALKLLSKNSSTSEKSSKVSVDSNQLPAKEAIDIEQIAALVQSRIPFSALVASEDEKVAVQDKIVSDGNVFMKTEHVSARESFDALNSLLDKATQLQQNLSADKNPAKTGTQLNVQTEVQPKTQLKVQAEMQPKEQVVAKELEQRTVYTGEQVDAKTIFGEKLVQEKIPELVARDNVQSKIATVQTETAILNDAKPAKTFVVNEEKAQLPQQEKPVQIAPEQKNVFVLTEENKDSSDSKGQMFQQQSRSFSTELSLAKKPMDASGDETSLNINASVTVGQAKETAPQRVFVVEEPVRLNDLQELADKMVEQARLTQKPGMTEMVIRLKPENLGELSVRIIAESGGAITAAFHSNSSEVRGILQEALPAIRQELANSGLKVHEVGVYAGLSDFQSFTGHEQRSAEQQAIAGVATNKLSKEEQELLEELQLAKNGENQNNDGGVDYRV